MKRQDVEAILKPIPGSRLGLEWNISGFLLVPYQLYPGIQVTVHYDVSTNLLRAPDELSVNLDSRDNETRRFKHIPLSEIE